MLLSKIKASRPFLLWKTFYAWLFFCNCILILTNFMGSITKTVEYRLFILDVLLTYGLLIFVSFLEMAILAVLMVLVEVLLERAFRKSLILVFRATLVALFVVTWVMLLQVVFRYVL